MPPRILILSSSVGAGHIRAAEALELALREVVPQATIRNLDVLEMGNRVFRWLYADTYIYMVNNIPHIYGHFYEQLERTEHPESSSLDPWRVWFDKRNLGKFMRLLLDDPWDLIFNTHFLPAGIVASLREKGKLSTPHVNAITDFIPHRVWVTQPCDRYFTATREGYFYLQSRGVAAKDIFITGIPIHPDFARPKERQACLNKHELVDDRPLVLQLSGGFGVGPVEVMSQALLEMPLPVHLVVVAGKNQALKERLEKMPVPERHRLKVYGYTQDMDELMTVADLVVSKPGGLTTSESLACGAVMAILEPTPGQETHNCDYLLENGAAIRVSHPSMLADKVGRLLQDRPRLEAMRANVRKIARPRAAFDIVERSLELIERKSPGEPGASATGERSKK
jgi:processive 1,2-diacylglycerol beta-glucosyltransferase